MGDTAVRVGTDSAFGRSRAVVRCPCGRVNRWFLWSWAGHGRARRKGCLRWCDYRTLEVTHSPGDTGNMTHG